MHKANLINSGIIPMTFADPDDYDKISQSDILVLKNIKDSVKSLNTATLINETTGEQYQLTLDLSDRARSILLAGGMLNYTANN